MNRVLPAAFLNFDSVRALSHSQLKAFSKRLEYISEIAAEISTELPKIEDGNDIRDFLDNLELDVSVNQTLPIEYGEVTSWNIHQSWTADILPMTLRCELGEDALSAIPNSAPKLDFGNGEYIEWAVEHGRALENALNNFYGAQRYEAAVANILLLDVILSRLLSGLVLSRFMAFQLS